MLRRVPLLPFYRSGPSTEAYHGGYQAARGRRNVALLMCGSGPRAAAEALAEFDERSRRMVGGGQVSLAASVGFAGAAQDDLRTGDLVADVRGLEAELAHGLIQGLKDAGLNACAGTVAAAERALAPEEKRAFPRAAAVDTQTDAVRRWAEGRGTPCLALRAVLDETQDRLPTALPLRPGWLAMAKLTMDHPAEAGLLWRTWFKSRKAGARLGRGARTLLECL